MLVFLRVFFCAVWSIFWISLSLIIYLFTFRTAIPVAMARSCWAPGILWAFRIRIEKSGMEVIERDKPYVFVCNHQSYLDIPILFRAIPANLYFVAKKELRIIPFLGWYMMATGMIFIDRSNRKKSMESLKRSAKLINQGKSVLMFPEGTRTVDHQIAHFKKGPFILSKEANVPILPIGIRQTGKSFTWGKWSSTQMVVSVSAPITCDGSAEVVEQVREKVALLANKPVASLTGG
ncbi:1-acyl-sn-glycerol-3-phosphate acyltransferase [Marinoscillum sp. 108]|uniref:1-acyl-sn-glycerol-3-phosphate acyltransferase n=1 Tax=Marinoscillum luteum TaxID=861051 RepID=A0ABW7N6R5_9BACT|nr:lysophospholipid acyltransferase family protein [Marinoscillum sp. 108]